MAFITLIFVMSALISCGPEPSSPLTTAPPDALPPSSSETDENGHIRVPEAPGTDRKKSTLSGESVIDYSNVSQGYVMLKNNGSQRKLKGYIKTPDGMFYQYDFDADDKFIVCPLQSGNGTYIIKIMEQTIGDLYRSISKVEVNVTLDDDMLPFLYPNSKVNFTSSSECVVKAEELTRGLMTDLEKIEAIYDFVTENILYDYKKAKEVQSGYISDPDITLEDGKGICTDFSVLLAAMLRSQNIPTQLVEGDVASIDDRHAWNMVYTKETGYVAAKIAFDGTWKILDSTRGTILGENVDTYIGDGSSYEEDGCF